jgi:MFS family permease
MSNFVELSRDAVRGAANGVMFMTFFGALWASIGIIGARSLWEPWLLISSGLVTLILFIVSLFLFGKGRKWKDSSNKEEIEHWKKVNRKFVFVFVLEGVAILITSVICNITNSFEFFFPIVAIIVGVHFFPLAQLFRVYFYHVTGLVLCILGIVTFFLPMDAAVNGVTIVATSVFIGFGSSLTLWLTGLTIWVTTMKQMKIK